MMLYNPDEPIEEEKQDEEDGKPKIELEQETCCGPGR